MYNRIRDSSILLTASSQSDHGIRQDLFPYDILNVLHDINLSVLQKLIGTGG